MVMLKKRGQVWVETVTYTLIALIMIGLILSFAKPEIEKMRDKVLIEQSLSLMKEIDQTIFEVGETVPGNSRILKINLKKGQITFNGEENTIEFLMESRALYSEPGQEFLEGNLKILTIEKGKYHNVFITRDYDGEYDILYKGENISKVIPRASSQYDFYIENKGGATRQINIEID